MRVNKTIRDYIDREVERRLKIKYQPMKQEAERQLAAVEAMNKGIQDASQKAAKEYVKEHIHEVKDFAEDNAANTRAGLPSFVLKRRYWDDSCHQWREQMRREKEAKVNEIAALLELGGDKEDLEMFLRDLDDEVAA